MVTITFTFSPPRAPHSSTSRCALNDGDDKPGCSCRRLVMLNGADQPQLCSSAGRVPAAADSTSTRLPASSQHPSPSFIFEPQRALTVTGTGRDHARARDHHRRGDARGSIFHPRLSPADDQRLVRTRELPSFPCFGSAVQAVYSHRRRNDIIISRASEHRAQLDASLAAAVCAATGSATVIPSATDSKRANRFDQARG